MAADTTPDRGAPAHIKALVASRATPPKVGRPRSAGTAPAGRGAPRGSRRASADTGNGTEPLRAVEGSTEVGRADLLLILGAVAGATPPKDWHPGLLNAWNRLSAAAVRTP
jgi:hypothetical protein